jgi:hypothetical protein
LLKIWHSAKVDAWLDEWEIQIGESLYDVITRALEKSRYIGIVLADNFDDSRYASDEMKQALARERRENRVVLLPLLFGKIGVPPFLETSSTLISVRSIIMRWSD